MALIIDGLASTFGGQKNQPNALKLVVYSMTPAWLVGVFSLIPGLRILAFSASTAFISSGSAYPC